MLQQFKSMNELVQYLGVLEERIKTLEEENTQLRLTSPGSDNIDEHTVAKYVASFMPLTNIIHPSFMKRAFAVWGHNFVASFIISLPFLILYLCLLAVLSQYISAH